MPPPHFENSANRARAWNHVQQQVAQTRTQWAFPTFVGQLRFRIPKGLWAAYAKENGVPVPSTALFLQEHHWFHTAHQRIHLAIPMGPDPEWHALMACLKEARLNTLYHEQQNHSKKKNHAPAWFRLWWNGWGSNPRPTD